MVCGSNYSILKLQSAASSVCGKWRKQQLNDPYLPPHAADAAATWKIQLKLVAATDSKRTVPLA